MQLWLKKSFEKADVLYELLPGWKKKLIDKKDFIKAKEKDNYYSMLAVRYDNNDWT